MLETVYITGQVRHVPMKTKMPTICLFRKIRYMLDMVVEQMHIACGQNCIYIVVSFIKVCQKSDLTHLYNAGNSLRKRITTVAECTFLV